MKRKQPIFDFYKSPTFNRQQSEMFNQFESKHQIVSFKGHVISEIVNHGCIPLCKNEDMVLVGSGVIELVEFE